MTRDNERNQRNLNQGQEEGGEHTTRVLRGEVAVQLGENDVAPVFWVTTTPQEFETICEAGGLGAEDCRRLWGILDRQDRPPEFIPFPISKEQAQRAMMILGARRGGPGQA